MSNKRTAAESSNNEQTNEGSDAESQQEDNAKRAKLTPLSHTTLQDLPIELLQRILVKAVDMEVTGMKLVKSVWKEKAELVISRLTTVCSQWSSILTTNFFRNELHRTLDSTAEEAIHLRALHELPIKPGSSRVTTLKDEIFLLLEEDQVINVYNCNRISDRGKAKDVIVLPRGEQMCMAACSVSNCVYVALKPRSYLDLAVFRITKEKEHKFNISPWIQDHRLPISMMSVSANGSLLILSFQKGDNPIVISIYNANGSLQREIQSPDINAERYKAVMQKSNGNVVLAYENDTDYQTTLLELDASGSEVRKYQSSFCGDSSVAFADIHGRFMIHSPFEGFLLLDTEFNFLGICYLQQDEYKNFTLYDLHYESETNEIMRIHYDRNYKTTVLTVLRLTDY